MYKLSLELGYINPYLKLKFSVVLKNDLGKMAYSKFSFSGNDYLRLSPFPSISIEIRSDVEKREMWSTNKIFQLDRFACFRLVKEGKRLIEDFKKLEDLFYYEGKELKVDKDLAAKHQAVVRTPFKSCIFLPNVVEDGATHQQYEGVTFFINSLDNYCMLTFEEFEFLIEYLDGVDFDGLALSIINTAILLSKTKPEELKFTGDQQVVVETPDKEEVSGRMVSEGTTIPNI